MIEFLLIALLQGVAGEPEPAPQPADAPGQTEQEQPQPSPPATTQADSERRVICHYETTVGSRIGRRRCFTASTEADAEREARNMLEHVQRPFSWNEGAYENHANGPR